MSEQGRTKRQRIANAPQPEAVPMTRPIPRPQVRQGQRRASFTSTTGLDFATAPKVTAPSTTGRLSRRHSGPTFGSRTLMKEPSSLVGRSPSPTPAQATKAKSPTSSLKAQLNAFNADQQQEFNKMALKPKTRALVKVLEAYGELNPHSWHCMCDPAGTGQSISMHSTCPTCFLPALDALSENEMTSEQRKRLIRGTVENMAEAGALHLQADVKVDDLVEALANSLESKLSVGRVTPAGVGGRRTVRSAVSKAKRTQRNKKAKHLKRKQRTLRKRLIKRKRGNKTQRHRS